MEYTFPVVALGASAGGLEPLEKFFENIHNSTKYAYVIIQHLAPNHVSLMDELLSRHTNLPIQKIEQGMFIRKGNIYLNPPKKIVEIIDGKFNLTEKEDRKLSFPISDFFISLAEQLQEKACAIILSGTGSDGSSGIKFIKENNGFVLVQDPNQSKFNGMPNSAINTGVVDKVCEVEAMSQEIDAFFENTAIILENNENTSQLNTIISKILKSIHHQINEDFTGYKYSTVSRRISRRMNALDFTKMEEYYHHLKNNAAEAHLLAKEFLIGVTRFFRDEDAFIALKQQVIPKLVEENADSKTIRVWVPACSTGEEAYTIAILIKDHLRVHKEQFNVNIFATDLDKDAIKLAANRVFSKEISSEIPIEYLNTYFIAQKNGYTIAKEIREMIVFSVHNVIQDPPFNKIDLISCRNLLIYLNNETQQQLFNLFQYSLKTNGFLFLGSSESLAESEEEFVLLNKKRNIYINKENKKFIQRLRTFKNKQKNKSVSENYIPFQLPINSNKKTILNEIQHVLIQEYVPNSLVIDQYYNLMHSSGNAHRLLTLPSGEISSNILKMLPKTLSDPLEVVVNKVFKTGNPLKINNIKIPEELQIFFNSQNVVNISVQKKEVLKGVDLLFIIFESSLKDNKEPVDYENINVISVSKEKIHILERELRINKETLQTTIEELESSNEELQATNEELQSSNEELESVNEELYTVNAEFQQKNQELVKSNDDLNNLIESSELAILFLDTNLNIRKFTPEIKSILDLVPHDIGRNIAQFRGKIQLENFLEHMESVLKSRGAFEEKIEDIKGREYLLKIAPFKTDKTEIEGIILVFVDLTQANRLRRALEISDKALEALESKHENQEEIFKLITNNLQDMVCIINKEGSIEYCNPSAVGITGYTLEELYTINFFETIVDKKYSDTLQKALDAIQQNQEPGLIEFEIHKIKGSKRWFETSIKPINQNNSSQLKFLLIISDIHQRKINEIEFIKNSLIAEQTSSPVLVTDIHGGITYTNDAFEKITGYSLKEVLGKKPGSFLQGPESDPQTIQLMSKSIQERKEFDVDIINYSKHGNKYIINIKAEPLYDKENNFIGFFSIQNDITQQQENINRVHKLNSIIKEQNEKLENSNKLLEEFAYVASHDLKTPVRNIKGMLELIKKKGADLDPKKKDSFFDIILSASDEMNQMINNLLEYSRTGISTEKLELVTISEILREIIRLFEQDLNECGGKIKINLEVEEIAVYPILFKRLLTNLISNSIKYRSEKKPLITVSNSIVNEKVLFLISDNGIGIPTDQFENIFTIFKSLKTNKDSNGIGLSVCKKIVELHGGSIWVESEFGEGTTIKFEISKN